MNNTPVPLSKRDPNQCPFCLAKLSLKKFWDEKESWKKERDKLQRDKTLLAQNAENYDDQMEFNAIMDGKIREHKLKYPWPICPNCHKKLQLAFYPVKVGKRIVMADNINQVYLSPPEDQVIKIVGNN